MSGVLRRLLIATLVTPPLGVVFAAANTGPTALPCAAAPLVHHVALVVEHGDGRSLRFCIGFDAASLSADQVLQGSGVQNGEADYGSLGKAVCQIDSEPATYPPTCWSSSSPFWVLFVSRAGGAWQSSSQGVSSLQLHDGDAEGFRYNAQSAPSAAPVSARGACVLSASTSPPRTTSPPRASPAVAAASATAAVPSGGSEQASGTGTAAAVASPPLRTAPTASSLSIGLVIAIVASGLLAGFVAMRVVKR